MSTGHPDAGLSGERTALAWQRTSLSLVAGAAILARMTGAGLGWEAAVPLLAACALAAWVFVESRRRYAADSGTFGRPRPRGGRAPLALAAATVLAGGTELVRLLLR